MILDEQTLGVAKTPSGKEAAREACRLARPDARLSLAERAAQLRPEIPSRARHRRECSMARER